MTDTFELIKSYALRIKNSRTLDSIFNHGVGETEEVEVELYKHKQGAPPGEDGIVGESADVVACFIDLIIQHDPNMTSEQFHLILDKKLQKWEHNYHNA